MPVTVPQSPLRRARAVLPAGSTLPADEFRRRHRLLLAVAWAHVPVLFLWALLKDLGLPHAVVEALLVALPSAAATWLFTDRRRSSALVAFALISCSAVVVHLSSGYIEAHFHFFVMIVALTLYEDWVPFGLAALYVLAHHGLAGVVAPDAVFNHGDAIAHPWKWAAIHAALVSAAGGFGIVAWKRNEDVRAEREQALARALAAEAEARAAADELARSNRDLEQFAYVASHDLSEPLRTVSSFVRLLGQRYEGKLDDEADEFIGYAVDGAQRMQQLIDDLLQYSRAGRAELERRPVDLDAVIGQVLGGLHHRIVETGAIVDVRPLGVVEGDAPQLAQVLQNLLSNAMKFVAEGPPRVTVAMAREDDAMVRITVADNGIGIAPEQAERVFKMFQRLHSREAYEGTGIGLAIVARIVERHGGRIWVEPGEAGGSAFHLTLPAGLPSGDEPPRTLEDDRRRAAAGHARAAA